jgi:hypothetical protein
MNKKIKVNTVKRFHYNNVGRSRSIASYFIKLQLQSQIMAIGRAPPFEAIL